MRSVWKARLKMKPWMHPRACHQCDKRFLREACDCDRKRRYDATGEVKFPRTAIRAAAASMVLLMVLGACAHRDPWTKADKALYGAVVAAQVADYVHTERFLDDGDHIMSAWSWKYGTAYPSDGRLALVKAAELGLALLVADQLPSKWRKLFLGVAASLLLYHVVYW